MGDLPDGTRRKVERLEERLPAEPPVRAPDVDDEVWRLLAHGRASKSGFDLKNAPLAAFLYRAQGDAGTDAFLEAARAAPRPASC